METAARWVLAMVGVCLLGYAILTPGSQPVAAFGGGILIGAAVRGWKW